MKVVYTNPSCSQCESKVDIIKVGNSYKCIIHARIEQMRKAARRYGKAVPSRELLEKLVAALESMKCPACGRFMNWWLKQGRSTVVTLQHDRSGEFKLICKGCNSRHHFFDGDTFYELKPNERRCIHCKLVKENTEFYKSPNRYSSGCKMCERPRAAKRAASKRRTTA